jgi:hypothetical protein
MKMRKQILSVLLILGFGFFLQACNDGPLEEAGESLDNAAEDVGDSLEVACEDITNENC